MEYNQVKECRICLGDEGKLISVCECKGTQAFVHLKCINRWRYTFPQGHDRHIICNLCFAPYNIPVPFWKRDYVKQWIHATTYSLVYGVIPICAIVSTFPCLSYQVQTLRAYYKPITYCNYEQFGWIVAESAIPAMEYIMLTNSNSERRMVSSMWLSYMLVCFVVASLDTSGIFVWLCFFFSMTLPCWTCCLLQTDVLCC